MAPAFGWFALGGGLVALFGIFALIAGVLGTAPGILQWFNGYGSNQMWLVIGVGFAVALVLGVVGLLAGKVGGGAAA
jgi:hypothetical protein